MTRAVLIWIIVLTSFLISTIEPSRAAEQRNRSASSLGGTWRWQFIMPDGSKVRPKLNLTIDNGKLTGTTSFGQGTEAPITNGVIRGDHLSFQVLRRRDDREILTTYTGQWNEKVITGKIESNWAGETQSFDWLAERSKFGAEGVWRWTNSLFAERGTGGRGGRGGRGNRGSETRVELAQEGEKLSGRTIVRAGEPVRIMNGSITNNEVYFEMERTIGDDKVLIIYRGKQTGDSIKGTMELESETDFREGNWEARRID